MFNIVPSNRFKKDLKLAIRPGSWGAVMFRRKAYEYHSDWKAQKKKKALCVTGVRQTGKTTLIREFGRQNYENFVEVNFVAGKMPGPSFSGGLDAGPIITDLSAYTRNPVELGRTLILDEVQEYTETRTAIKFLVEAVRLYVGTHDIARVAALQTDILKLYRLDISNMPKGSTN